MVNFIMVVNMIGKDNLKKGWNNMNIDRLLKSVKEHEGYRNKVYLDSLGKRTVGVGHLCVEDFWLGP